MRGRRPVQRCSQQIMRGFQIDTWLIIMAVKGGHPFRIAHLTSPRARRCGSLYKTVDLLPPAFSRVTPRPGFEPTTLPASLSCSKILLLSVHLMFLQSRAVASCTVTTTHDYHCKDGAEVGYSEVTSGGMNITTCYCARDNCNPMDGNERQVTGLQSLCLTKLDLSHCLSFRGRNYQILGEEGSAAGVRLAFPQPTLSTYSGRKDLTMDLI